MVVYDSQRQGSRAPAWGPSCPWTWEHCLVRETLSQQVTGQACPPLCRCAALGVACGSRIDSALKQRHHFACSLV